jgi:uncharacterized protein (TIGR03032 family)
MEEIDKSAEIMEKPETSPEPTEPAKQPDAVAKTEISCSRGLAAWLRAQNLSLAFTSYQTGLLYLVGAQPNGVLSVNQIGFARAMGLWATAQRIYLAVNAQVWRLENMLRSGQLANQHFDRCYIPRNSQATGEIDLHELAVQPSGRVVFVNTAFSCLAEFDKTHSFRPIWKPPFISKLAPEDRCHLNGLCMEEGKPRYVTAVCRSDIINGWRDRRAESGIIIDLATDQVLTEQLSMPHSPRLWNGALWVLDSGRGFLCRVDRKSGKLTQHAFLPGFLRGLAFYGNSAVVGLSLPRDKTFSGLDLDANLKARDGEPWCGIQVIDLNTGDVQQWLRLEGQVRELFDVAVLPGVRCPMGVSPQSREFATTISRVEEFGSLDGVGEPPPVLARASAA